MKKVCHKNQSVVTSNHQAAEMIAKRRSDVCFCLLSRYSKYVTKIHVTFALEFSLFALLQMRLTSAECFKV